MSYRARTYYLVVGVLLFFAAGGWGSLLLLLSDERQQTNHSSVDFSSSRLKSAKFTMTAMRSSNKTRASTNKKTNETLGGNGEIASQLLLGSEPDAYLEGWPLQLVQNQQPPYSRVHCVAENFQADTVWMYRSCHYTNLCFDLTEKVFVLHPSPLHQQLEADIMQRRTNKSALQHQKDGVAQNTFLSSTSKDVMGGGAHAYWLKRGRGKWKPALRNASSSSNYYKLDAVWVSFFPLGGCNAGHNLWDVFLPIYTLLEQFDLVGDGSKKRLFLTVMPSKQGQCAQMVTELAPMMGVSDIKLVLDLKPTTTPVATGNTSNLVCATHSASGMGFLTDHGLNEHGGQLQDYLNPVNVHRNSNLERFRAFLLRNIGIDDNDASKGLQVLPPYKVIFSILSSKEPKRRFDFAKSVQVLRSTRRMVPHNPAPRYDINSTGGGDQPPVPLSSLLQIESIAMWNYTIPQQALLTCCQAAIYVSACGGGTAPAFFLPKGATLILYGNDLQRLDWDLWNNYAHLRVHWLSMEHMEEEEDLLVKLIQDEVETLLAASR
jgi:hypothetical protein